MNGREPAPAPDRLFLKQVAKRLETYRIASKGEGAAQLLMLLQDGVLVARLNFPGRSSPVFNVPQSYWRDLSSGRFKKDLTYLTAKSRYSAHLIPAVVLLPEYSRWFTKEGPKTADELQSAFSQPDNEIEPFIFTNEWQQYAERTAPKESSIVKQRVGAPEQFNWPEILIHVAAYMLASPQLRDKEIASLALRDTGTAVGARDPAAGTVEKKISAIRKIVKSIKTNGS